MKFLPHQEIAAHNLAEIFKRTGVAYLAGEPRSGKTATALKMMELVGAKNVLCLTKKNAIGGWKKEMSRVGIEIAMVTNYEQAKKISAGFDAVILDEAHALGKVGKINQRIKDVKKVVGKSPILLLSGTPVVETPLAIFHQFCVSTKTPFRHRSFYDFFREWGIARPVWVGGRAIESYKMCRPELVKEIGKYTVTITQADAGIKADLVQQRIHSMSLGPTARGVLNQARVESGIDVDGTFVPFESHTALRSFIHQAEFGAYKMPDGKIAYFHTDLVHFLRGRFEMDSVAVMCHYHSTKFLIAEHFPKTPIYSSNAHSEGVDLSHHKNLIIIGTDFSGAKHIQRIERQANIMREKQRMLHMIVTPEGISADVLAALTDKRDYNISAFRKWSGSGERGDNSKTDFELA